MVATELTAIYVINLVKKFVGAKLIPLVANINYPAIRVLAFKFSGERQYRGYVTP